MTARLLKSQWRLMLGVGLGLSSILLMLMVIFKGQAAERQMDNIIVLGSFPVAEPQKEIEETDAVHFVRDSRVLPVPYDSIHYYYWGKKKMLNQKADSIILFVGKNSHIIRADRAQKLELGFVGGYVKASCYSLVFQDFNFDGLCDLSLNLGCGPGVCRGPVYIYQPQSKKLVYEPALSKLDHATAIPDRKLISAYWRAGGGVHGSSLYNYKNGKLTFLSSVDQSYEQKDRFLTRVHKRHINGLEVSYKDSIGLNIIQDYTQFNSVPNAVNYVKMESRFIRRPSFLRRDTAYKNDNGQDHCLHKSRINGKRFLVSNVYEDENILKVVVRELNTRMHKVLLELKLRRRISNSKQESFLHLVEVYEGFFANEIYIFIPYDIALKIDEGDIVRFPAAINLETKATYRSERARH